MFPVCGDEGEGSIENDSEESNLGNRRDVDDMH